jgi:phosphatidylserine decarboxylase
MEVKVIIISGFSIIVSTLLYIYIRKKTGIRTRFIFIDNPIVFTLGALTAIILYYTVFHHLLIPALITVLFMSGLLTLTLSMIRFWRTPARKCNAEEPDIVSPADGKIIYIKKIDNQEEPISVKKGEISRLTELTKTELLQVPCWLIGINMTPLDVHKNSAPISGRIIFSQHFNGKFFSLKSILSETENERHTIIIQSNKLYVGVIQIASKLVRRIDTYIKEGDLIERGQWYGMIKLGSQVDVVIPANYILNVDIFEQVFAGETILAKPPDEAVN